MESAHEVEDRNRRRRGRCFHLGAGGRSKAGQQAPTPPGKAISAIAKNGGGVAAILGALIQAKPNNPGLPKALFNVTKPKPTPTPDPAPTS